MIELVRCMISVSVKLSTHVAHRRCRWKVIRVVCMYRIEHRIVEQHRWCEFKDMLSNPLGCPCATQIFWTLTDVDSRLLSRRLVAIPPKKSADIEVVKNDLLTWALGYRQMVGPCLRYH